MRGYTARRTLNVAALIAFAVYVAFICLYLSARRMMAADDLNAWNLLTDPSWRHAFESLKQGADSGTPAFYAIGRGLLAVAGQHPLVMRLYSAMCFYLAAVVWAQILKRYFGDFIGIAAVFVAFLCNPEVLNQIGAVRFYGEVMFAVAVAVRISLWLQDSEHSTVVWLFSSGLGGLLLVAAHPLGLIYSAAILLCQMCIKSPIRKRIAALAGTVLSWSYLLIFLGPVKNAADQDIWLRPPNAAAVQHFYDNTPLLFIHLRYVSVLLNLVLLFLAAYATVWFIRSRKDVKAKSFVLLVYVSFAMMLEPLGFAILSNLYRPVFLGRYLLPYSLGLITLAAAGAWLLTQRIDHRSMRIAAPIVAVALLPIPYFLLAEQYQNPVSNLDTILQVAQSTPTVVADDAIVRDAHLYAPDKAKNLFFVMTPSKGGGRAILAIIAERGYASSLVYDQPFLRAHRQFLYIADAWQLPFYSEYLQGSPLWRESQIGSVVMHGRTVPVLQFTRVDEVEKDNDAQQKGPEHLLRP